MGVCVVWVAKFVRASLRLFFIACVGCLSCTLQCDHSVLGLRFVARWVVCSGLACLVMPLGRHFSLSFLLMFLALRLDFVWSSLHVFFLLTWMDGAPVNWGHCGQKPACVFLFVIGGISIRMRSLLLGFFEILQFLQIVSSVVVSY